MAALRVLERASARAKDYALVRMMSFPPSLSLEAFRTNAGYHTTGSSSSSPSPYSSLSSSSASSWKRSSHLKDKDTGKKFQENARLPSLLSSSSFLSARRSSAVAAGAEAKKDVDSSNDASSASSSFPNAALEYGFVEPRDPKTRKREGFPKSYRRCGAVAMKCGMTREWDSNGVGVPLTVLWLDENRVIQVKGRDKSTGLVGIQVGAGSKRHKNVNKSLIGHFRKHLGDETPVVSRKVIEFKVTDNCVLEAGTAINADHFVVGQLVDVQGTTKGKGFAGGMKRHGMKGGPASHGTTKAHRTIGSTGQCQDPGRVFKGKKMPGRMGGKACTQQSLLVYKIDPVHNLIYIKGQVPGGKGSYVRILDSKIAFQEVALPYPTRAQGQGQEEVTIAYASTKHDPFTRYWQF